MRILVIGGGAIGRMLTYKLWGSRSEVALVARPTVADAIRARRSMVHTATYHNNVWTREVYTSIAEAFGDGQKYDIVVIAVKSYDTEGVANELRSVIHTDTIILTVQNGVGNDAVLRNTVGGAMVTAALTTQVEAVNDAEIRIADDRFWIGIAGYMTSEDAVRAVHDAFVSAEFAVEVYNNADALKWSKLAMNLMANATCAILDWTPVQIFSDPRIGALEMEMLRETLAVMEAIGIPVVPIGGNPLPAIARLVRHVPIAVSRRIIGPRVAKARGDRMPSLWHAVTSQSHRSEVDWLYGAVLREGKKRGIPTPVIGALTQSIGSVVAGDLTEYFRNHPEHLLRLVSSFKAELSSSGR